MTSFIRAGAVLVPCSIGYFGYWTVANSGDIKDENKDKLFIRMTKVAQAWFRQKLISSDDYTARWHTRTVAQMSGKLALEPSQVQKEEINIGTAYYAGYTYERMNEDMFWNPVFRFDEHLPVVLPLPEGETHKGFRFAGYLSELFDPKAQEQILQGNYIRCQALVKIGIGDNYDQYSEKETDVFITGTTDRTQCLKLKHAILRDAAFFATRHTGYINMACQSPMADTPVLDYTASGFEEVGELSGWLSESVTEKIRNGNFTACTFFRTAKTRLSNGSYKEQGAIVAGVADDPKVCSEIHFKMMRTLLNQNGGE